MRPRTRNGTGPPPAPRLTWRRIDGLLLVDKPLGETSNRTLQRVRRLFAAEKAGHGGTLDPMASGLLPVLFGEATKFAARLLDADKTYQATIRLGARTSTGDAEGDVIAQAPIEFDASDVDRVFAAMEGAQTQLPPMFSALKRGGQPLYRLARQGIAVERTPRKIQIRSLRLQSLSATELAFEVVCSKGTYVRTLAETIAERLGTLGHLSGLRRLRAGRLSVADALEPGVLEALDEEARLARLKPLEYVVQDLPRATLPTAHEAKTFSHGGSVPFAGGAGEECAVFDPAGRFLGLGALAEGGFLQPRRMVAQSPADGAREGQDANASG